MKQARINVRIHIVSTGRDCSLSENISVECSPFSNCFTNDRVALAMNEQMQVITGKTGLQLDQICFHCISSLVTVKFARVEVNGL